MGQILLPSGELATPEVETTAVAARLREGTSAVENFPEIRFESKLDAERWMSKCVIRWTWLIGVVDATPYADEATYLPRARRAAGAIHDTTSPLFKRESGDVKLDPYVQIVHVADKCFALTNRF